MPTVQGLTDLHKNILIIGGTSGLGLELARHYVCEGHTVCITGRVDPDLHNAQFQTLDISSSSVQLEHDLNQLLTRFPLVNTLIYAAGFYQYGPIDALNTEDILTMTNVGLVAPMMLVNKLKHNNNNPLKVMLITSSSQYTPREKETVYCAVKSGLGMFGASLVKDPMVGKVLVAAPSGMRTAFWKGTENNLLDMLDPVWVAQQVIALSSGGFKYKFAKILRNPARVETIACDDANHQSLLLESSVEDPTG